MMSSISTATKSPTSHASSATTPLTFSPVYDYDVTNEDALLHSLSVQGGQISSPAGNQYRLLVLPRGRKLSLASLEQIATYVHDGGALSGPSAAGSDWHSR